MCWLLCISDSFHFYGIWSFFLESSCTVLWRVLRFSVSFHNFELFCYISTAHFSFLDNLKYLDFFCLKLNIFYSTFKLLSFCLYFSKWFYSIISKFKLHQIRTFKIIKRFKCSKHCNNIEIHFTVGTCYFSFHFPLVIHRSYPRKVEQVLNGPVAKLYNSDNVNVTTTELRQTKATFVSFKMIDILSYETKEIGVNKI